MSLRDKALEQGASSLREFGYPNCTAENILSVSIYRAFFYRMVNQSLSAAKNTGDTESTAALTDLLAEITALDNAQA